MAKPKGESPGRGRLLDAWAAPSDAGAPVGCVATSYTFDSVFFEEECLGLFAGIRGGSSVDEKGWEWIIEREERFGQINAVALVDKDHCQGTRSPRWDLLCARGGPKAGILHAKLSLLVWARHVRLIVASANLTPSGYRKNREVFACLEAGQDMPMANEAWNEALDYLESLLPLGGESGDPGVFRAAEIIRLAREKVRELSKLGRETDLSVKFFGLGPGKQDLFRRLSKHWGEASGPVDEIVVISPFFDQSPNGIEGVRKAVWGLARERGEATFTLYAPMVVEPDGTKRLLAPEGLSIAPRASASVIPFGIVELDEVEKERRALHAKWYWLENPEWALSCFGSANLTSAGTGLSSKPNWEAMLSVLLKYERSKDEYNSMDLAWDGIGGEETKTAIWAGSAIDEEEDETSTVDALPDAFKKAVYQLGANGPELVLDFGDGLPDVWTLWIPEGDKFTDQTAWIQAGKPSSWILPWRFNAAPSGLELRWGQASEKRAWLPICVLNSKHLPPPEELRDLPLEALIEVLTTARPLAQTLAAWIMKKQTRSSNENQLLDPHARVDVSGYLIPRTRRVSKALAALREKLSEPMATEETLRWRLEGPFGAKAVAKAMAAEARDSEEKVFFLSELCLELAQVKPAQIPGCLDAVKVSEAIRIFIQNQAIETGESLGTASAAMRGYAQAALEKAGNAHA